MKCAWASAARSLSVICRLCFFVCAVLTLAHCLCFVCAVAGLKKHSCWSRSRYFCASLFGMGTDFVGLVVVVGSFTVCDRVVTFERVVVCAGAEKRAKFGLNHRRFQSFLSCASRIICSSDAFTGASMNILPSEPLRYCTCAASLTNRSPFILMM